MRLYTTLHEIRDHYPCEDSWKSLLKSLKKTKADDKKLSLAYILKALNVQDAIWALRAVDGHEKEVRLFACDCAERVLPIFEKDYPADKRPREAIRVSRLYAKGKVTEKELAAARVAAWDAVADAARDAAWAAARAARVAAWAAARDGAWAPSDATWVAEEKRLLF